MANLIDIEIDGKTLQVPQGSMIIEAADNANIPIPRFCYHKKLSVAANCRMCLIEVEKVGKPLPACATPVTPGMKIFTTSSKAREAQRAVMEFLLINHPLDCPICDQGGECELQDNSLQYGQDISHYSEGKRSVADEDLGPLVATEMTRCIQCTRCVRFGEEIAGIPELGTLGRGEKLYIGTYIKESLTSAISGNIIDLCPVGALTSKPFRFKARAWELTQHPSIASHDCVGSNISIHHVNDKVMRVVPRHNESLNETWISDRDRFSYLGVNSHDRLLNPHIKKDGHWVETDWQTALNHVAARLKSILERHGPEQLGALISPNATTEECYLLQKLYRELNCHNIDHRVRQTDFSDQQDVKLFPGFHELSLSQLEEKDVIFLVGSHLPYDQPLAGLRVRKACLQGASVLILNPIDYAFNFPVSEKLITHPSNLVDELAGITKAMSTMKQVNIPIFESLLDQITVSPKAQAMGLALAQAKQGVILLGNIVETHPHAATLRSLAHLIAELSLCQVGELTMGANTAGAWIAGAIPHRRPGGNPAEKIGLTAQQMLDQRLKSYFLFNLEPDLDFQNPAATQAALFESEFVVALTPFDHPSLRKYADVLLPISTPPETSGTFINVEGLWQDFSGAIPPPGEARPGWKVLRVIANLMGLTHFDYVSSELVRQAVLNSLEHRPENHYKGYRNYIDYQPESPRLTKFSVWPMYRSDNVVRRAHALQKTSISEKPGLYVNAETALQLDLQAGQLARVEQQTHKVSLAVFVDERIPTLCAYIPMGFSETSTLGSAVGPIDVAGA